MTRKWLLPVVAVIVVLVAGLMFASTRFASTSSVAGPGAAPQVIDIGTFSTAIDYAPYYVAKQKGWLAEAAAKHNATLNFVDFESLPAINDALAADRLDVLLEADTPAIIQEAAGNDIMAVSPLASLSLQLVVPPKSAIVSLKDLRGKKIAVLSGSGFHYGLVAALDAAGLPRDSYSVVNLGPAEAKGALASGSVDAWAVWPPFPQLAQIDGTGKIIPIPTGQVTSLGFASAKFLKGNPALIGDLEKALARARQFISQSPEEARQIVSAETKLPLEVVTRAWPSLNFNFIVTPQVTSSVQKQADFLVKGGYINRSVDIDRDLMHAGQ